MTMIDCSSKLLTPMEEEEKEKLPLDLVYEVLTWCDVNALASHRLVCKKWHNLLTNPNFIKLNLQRTKTLRGFFLRTKDIHYDVYFVTPMLPLPELPSLDFMPEDVRIEASTGGQAGHGLLCCVDQGSCDRPRFYVCKPSTREWTRIPNPRTRFSTIKMGMGVVALGSPPEFKIVRLSEFENYQAKFCAYFTEVFDSAKWEWEMLPSHSLLNFQHLGTVTGTGLLINTSVYWLTIPLLPKLVVARVVSFDITTNEWSEVGLPEIFVYGARKPPAKDVDNLI